MPRLKKHILSILVVTGLTVLAYSGAFKNSFVYDDHPFVVENTAIRDLGWKNIVSNFTDKNTLAAHKDLSGNAWRPLTTTSFAIDYRLWGPNPFFYHVENILLHSLNAILVYIAAILLFDDILIALIASLIFAVHPVNTEAVTWISGRSNLLFLLFFLSSLICHLRNRYVLTLIFFVCSLLAKEMAITLPLILILCDIHLSAKNKLRERIAYYAPFFLIAAFYLLARHSILGSIAQNGAWAGWNIPGNIAVVAKSVAGYIRLLIIPVNLRIIYLIDRPRSTPDAETIAAFLALALIAAGWIALRRRKNVSFCFGWFFIALIPVCSIIPIQIMMAERFLYLPSIAFAFLLAIFVSAVYHKFKNNPKALGVLAVLVTLTIGLYSAAVVSRNAEWKDDISLCRNEVLRSPGNSLSHHLLGIAYEKEGRKADSRDKADIYYKLAVKEFGEAVSLKPDARNAYFELANTYNLMGSYDLAVDNFKKAAAFGEDAGVYNNLSIAYWHLGKYDRAIASCKRAIRLEPSYYYPYINLGNAYFGKGEYSKAKEAWRIAAQVRPAKN